MILFITEVLRKRKLRAEISRIKKEVEAFENYKGFLDQPWRDNIIKEAHRRIHRLEVQLNESRRELV